MTYLYATLTSKGQITLPKGIRDSMNLQEGDEVRFINKNEESVEMEKTDKRNRTILSLLAYIIEKEKIVVIEGESGVGKSRLIHDYLERYNNENERKALINFYKKEKDELETKYNNLEEVRELKEIDGYYQILIENAKFKEVEEIVPFISSKQQVIIAGQSIEQEAFKEMERFIRVKLEKRNVQIEKYSFEDGKYEVEKLM